jgi:hypothetical protein
MPTNRIEYIWPGIIAAQAIHVVAKLRIPDLLASKDQKHALPHGDGEQATQSKRASLVVFGYCSLHSVRLA